jgi:hypothetical protein
MDKLPEFLRKIASDIENNTISEDELLQVSEFYMKNCMKNCMKKSLADPVENISNDDVIKFTTLGWYIYKFLLEKN